MNIQNWLGARLLAAGLLAASVALAAHFPAHAASQEPAPKSAKANRLLNAPSPYLRQHAYNPVDWYPWG
ncbi:MAG: DUF255 domain-containing protein, partial [Hyphomicrobiaceae bacterium]